MRLAYDNHISRDSPQITVIEGCPGSGKSRVIKNIVMETLKYDVSMEKSVNSSNGPLRILVCAKSNSCIDEITEKLIDAQFGSGLQYEVLRLGMNDRMSRKVQMVGLVAKISKMNTQQRRVSN